MVTSDLRRLRVLWWTVLVLVLGPIWTVKHDIWDGVIGAYGLEQGNYSGIHEWLVPGNWGLMYLIIRAIGALSELLPLAPWVLVKLLLTISVAGISYEARRLCSDLLHLDERTSRAAALLVLAFPCWYLLYGSTFVYLVFIWWVFLGHRWLHAGGARWRQLAGYLMLLASFQVNSNFVMVFALEGARWLCRDRSHRWNWPRSVLACGAAVAVYLVLRWGFPPRGAYLGYNNLILPTSSAGLAAWARAALMFCTWLPLLAAPSILAWLLMRGRSFVPGEPQVRATSAVALLFIGALFAYMAVGKGAPLFIINVPVGWLGTTSHLGRNTTQWLYTTAEGWSTRHTFLFSVPATIASLWLLQRITLSRSDKAAARRAWWAGVSCALVLGLAWMAHGHAAKLRRLAQEESIVRALWARPAPPQGRLDLRLLPRPGWSVWTYEANYWMWLAYRRTAWAVAVPANDGAGEDPALRDREMAVAAAVNPASRDYYLMSGYLPGGCYTEMQVELPGLHGMSLWLDRLGLQAIGSATLRETARHCAAE